MYKLSKYISTILVEKIFFDPSPQRKQAEKHKNREKMTIFDIKSTISENVITYGCSE